MKEMKKKEREELYIQEDAYDVTFRPQLLFIFHEEARPSQPYKGKQHIAF